MIYYCCPKCKKPYMYRRTSRSFGGKIDPNRGAPYNQIPHCDCRVCGVLILHDPTPYDALEK